ncbi:MAG: hypothetical protein A3G18_01160 [Rhodospirillales bacterium RIFCSPLOWO2_12_FULL_58_28]|nr:MAG: hypothetical protein A3H92_04360 [Rhodospirillales bacterium RIFCSPLOWO2_02_FULL_58_16]OHC78012.1 MAG: hypothetical protein A3G18_01160 [Rhodospirillales bacterium RIFCSPLOWO2_12_FULL_58_28]
MKISVKKVAAGVYSLKFDDAEIVLESDELKELLLNVTKVLIPVGIQPDNYEEKAREFISHIKHADNVGIQKFIIVAGEDDIIVLLKTAENDKELLEKFYGNMSDRSRKMITEDLNYKFENGVPSGTVKSAFNRLIKTAKNLESEGSMIFENIASGIAIRDLKEG